MLPEADRVRLEHMLGAARSAVGFIQGRRRPDLDSDDMLMFALVHALAIIGEAASQVSVQTRQTLPLVPWRLIVGMRHRLVHGYFEVDLDRVWDTATQYVPTLIEQLEAVV
jgi:uncharacterized protein with HEPN domain